MDGLVRIVQFSSINFKLVHRMGQFENLDLLSKNQSIYHLAFTKFDDEF